jgi:hypothetical protein
MHGGCCCGKDKDNLKNRINEGINAKLNVKEGKYPKYDFNTNYLDPKEKSGAKKFWSQD